MSDAEIKTLSSWRSMVSGVEVTVTGVDRNSNRVVFRQDNSEEMFDLREGEFRRRFTPIAPPASATPAHYDFAIQPIDAIRAWGLNFAMGNVVKYVVRADRKGTPLDDLVKARDYLDDEIAERRKGAAK